MEEHITLTAKDIKALTGAKDEVRALWSLQLKGLKESAKPFVRKVRQIFRGKVGHEGSDRIIYTMHKGQTTIKKKHGYIGTPQVYYKEIKEDHKTGMPLLLMFPANNGFHWFDMGTDKRYTDSRKVLRSTVQVGRRKRDVVVRSGRGGYKGYIKPMRIFAESFQSTQGQIQNSVEESMDKVINKAIERALKKSTR